MARKASVSECGVHHLGQTPEKQSGAWAIPLIRSRLVLPGPVRRLRISRCIRTGGYWRTESGSEPSLGLAAARFCSRIRLRKISANCEFAVQARRSARS